MLYAGGQRNNTERVDHEVNSVLYGVALAMSPRKMYFGGLLLYIPFCHRVHARRTDAHSSDITVLSMYAQHRE